MIQYWKLNELTDMQRAKIMRRAEQDISDLLPTAQEVVERVRTEGDEAVVAYTRKFDAENYTAEMIRATPEDFAAAHKQVSAAVIDAIKLAHDNIRRFHEEQMPEPMWFMEVKPGIMAGEKITPVTSAALYVPRGKGAFPSVMLMLATPAKVAGVEKIIVVTPPTPEGKADAASLVAAERR